MMCPIKARKYKWRNEVLWELSSHPQNPVDLLTWADNYQSCVIWRSYSRGLAECACSCMFAYMREGADWYLCASLRNCLFLPPFFKNNSRAARRGCLGCRWFWKLHFPGETRKSLEPDSSAQTAWRFPSLKRFTAGAHAQITLSEELPHLVLHHLSDLLENCKLMLGRELPKLFFFFFFFFSYREGFLYRPKFACM